MVQDLPSSVAAVLGAAGDHAVAPDLDLLGSGAGLKQARCLMNSLHWRHLSTEMARYGHRR
jgi:hypothetical protein